MKCRLIIVIFLAIICTVEAQVDTSFLEKFKSPVHYKIRLSGSFGELRSNHFHTGIDIKGKNSTAGDSLFSVMSGHISRIRIQSGSYGKCMYVDHPNGMTSVYAHLEKFSPAIERIIEKKQQKSKSFEIDWYPKQGKLKLDQGEFIGYLGNTGRSYGPHLHFELRDTETELTVNPLYYGFGVSDRKAPFISQIMIHEVDSNFQVMNKQIIGSNQTIVRSQNDLIGIGFKGYDQMDGSSNYNGIVNMKLYSDNKLIYESEFDSIGFDEFRYINACIDYEEKYLRNSTYFLCYRQPNNLLTNVKKEKRDGIISLKDTTNVKIVLSDLSGNRTVKEFNLIKQNNGSGNIKASKKRSLKFINKSSGRASVSIPPICLYRPQNVFFNFDSLQNTLRIGKSMMPCHSYYDIEIKGLAKNDALKLFYVKDNGTQICVGGNTDGNVFTCKLNKFGRFILKEDKQKPSIKFLNKTSEYIKFLVKDDHEVSGIAEEMFLEVSLDGKWIPFYYKSLNKHLKIDSKFLNGDNLLISATDGSGNRKNYKFSL